MEAILLFSRIVGKKKEGEYEGFARSLSLSLSLSLARSLYPKERKIGDTKLIVVFIRFNSPLPLHLTFLNRLP